MTRRFDLLEATVTLSSKPVSGCQSSRQAAAEENQHDTDESDQRAVKCAVIAQPVRTALHEAECSTKVVGSIRFVHPTASAECRVGANKPHRERAPTTPPLSPGRLKRASLPAGIGAAEKRHRKGSTQLQQVLPFQAVRAKTEKMTKPLRVSQLENAASPGRVSRRAQGGRERPPVFGRWSAQNPLGSASGRSRPPCANTMLRLDLVDEIADDVDVDNDVITERDIRVDLDDFNFVDNSRITRKSPTSSRSTRRWAKPTIEPKVNRARGSLQRLGSRRASMKSQSAPIYAAPRPMSRTSFAARAQLAAAPRRPPRSARLHPTRLLDALLALRRVAIS